MGAAGWVSWVPSTGQDSVADHSSPDIDFVAFHSWIDNWQPGVSVATPTSAVILLLAMLLDALFYVAHQNSTLVVLLFCVSHVNHKRYNWQPSIS